MSSLTRRQVCGLAAFAALAASVAALRLLVYRSPLDLQVEFAWPSEAAAQFRMTALLIAGIVGAALGVSGVLLQALLRNPLAEPYILGVSSGAGLGVMAAMFAAHRWGVAWLEGQQTLPAVFGGIAVLAIVYGLGQRRGALEPVTLVLVGVIVSSICGAGIMFFQHAVGTGLRGEFTMWLMGTISEVAEHRLLWVAGGATFLGLLVATMLGRAMDAGTLGDDEARSVGLALGRVRLLMFVVASVLAAMTVALAGPIGFVGLVCPHAARLVLGPRHGPVVIGAAMAGIVMVVGADVARQVINIGTGRMPIGIYTAAVGGPVFIMLLLSGRGQS